MNEDMAEYALTLASTSEVTYAEVRLEKKEENEIVLKNGILEGVGYTVDEGMGIRIITKEGIGFSSTNVLDRVSVAETAYEALKQSKSCRRKPQPMLSEEKSEEATWNVSERKKLSNVGIEEKLDNFFSIDKTISSLGDIPGRLFLLSDKQVEKLFLNSEGSRIRGYLPIINTSYFLTVKEGNEVEQTSKNFGYTGGWEGFEAFNLEKDCATQVKAAQTLIKTGKKSPQGKMDLVVGPDVVGVIAHESCGHPSEADRILGREASQAGESFMSVEFLGTRIGSEHVTVADDPRVEHTYGYYAYDDEGVKARRRLLYKDGIINEFLHNRESAAMMGTHSNGSSRSENYNRESIVRMGNTFVLPGNYEMEELIENISSGIYMKSFSEWNIDDKRFNQKYVGREAYLIEHGETTHMVKRPILEVTTPAFWSAVDACGKDLTIMGGGCGKGDPIQGMAVGAGGPTIRLRNINMR